MPNFECSFWVRIGRGDERPIDYGKFGQQFSSAREEDCSKWTTLHINDGGVFWREFGIGVCVCVLGDRRFEGGNWRTLDV